SAHPARLLVISTFPYALQSFGSVGLLNNMQYDFNDRFDGSSDYFKRNERIRKRWEQANFVKDIRTAEVVAWEERGEGNASMYWDMAGNTILEPHISEFEVGSYKLEHRHPYEAIILNGKGFSLAGKNNLKDNEAVKMEWKAGSVVSPPFFWFHQHFNVGMTPARYLAITEGDFPKRLGIPLEVEQIEKEQEDPAIRRLFDSELQKAARKAGGSPPRAPSRSRCPELTISATDASDYPNADRFVNRQGPRNPCHSQLNGFNGQLIILHVACIAFRRFRSYRFRFASCPNEFERYAGTAEHNRWRAGHSLGCR